MMIIKNKCPLIIVICFLSIINSFAQTLPNWLSEEKAKWGNYVQILSTTKDVANNTYIAGYFRSPSFDSFSVNFGTIVLTKRDEGDHVVIAKYDSNGKALWAYQAGGGDYDSHAVSSVTDDLGNTYAVGFFKSGGIGFGSYDLENAGGYGFPNVFVVKYDLNGNVIWANSPGGKNHGQAISVKFDEQGKIVVSCSFEGSGTVWPYDFANVLSGEGYENEIALKCDTNGTILSATRIPRLIPAKNNYGISITTKGLTDEYAKRFLAQKEFLDKAFTDLEVSKEISPVKIEVAYSNEEGNVSVEFNYVHEKIFNGSNSYSKHNRDWNSLNKGISVSLQDEIFRAISSYIIEVAKNNYSYDKEIYDFESEIKFKKANGDFARFFATKHNPYIFYKNVQIHFAGKDYEVTTTNPTLLNNNKFFGVGKTIGLDGSKTGAYYFCKFFSINAE